MHAVSSESPPEFAHWIDNVKSSKMDGINQNDLEGIVDIFFTIRLSVVLFGNLVAYGFKRSMHANHFRTFLFYLLPKSCGFFTWYCQLLTRIHSTLNVHLIVIFCISPIGRMLTAVVAGHPWHAILMASLNWARADLVAQRIFESPSPSRKSQRGSGIPRWPGQANPIFLLSTKAFRLMDTWFE